MDYTIAQEFVLPSKGLIYDKEINPNIKLRSMTTNEEMKRLAYTETPYKTLCEIIDDCLVVKPGISSYDMCIGDYQFLLHRLRMVTYGTDYSTQSVCPYCGELYKTEIKLDELPLLELDERIDDLLEFTLPVTKKRIKLRVQTPRMMDEVATRKKAMQERHGINNKGDISLLLLIDSLIEKVDGQAVDSIKLEQFIRTLPMRDTNKIIKTAEKISLKVGIDTLQHNVCVHCGGKFDSSFRITSEFFGPTED